MSKVKTAVGTPDPDDEPLAPWERDLLVSKGGMQPGKPDATIVQFDGELTEEQISYAREYVRLMQVKGGVLHLPVIKNQGSQVRQFASGATRDTDEGKLDFEAYLSPHVLLRYAQYMQEHQTRSDGTKRAGDDWQQGMPKDAYMKSMLRHAFDVWLHHRNHGDMAREDIETALCAVIFNAMGYLFNELEGLE